MSPHQSTAASRAVVAELAYYNAVRAAALVCRRMIVGGRAWDEGQAAAANILESAASEICKLDAGERVQDKTEAEARSVAIADAIALCENLAKDKPRWGGWASLARDALKEAGRGISRLPRVSCDIKNTSGRIEAEALELDGQKYRFYVEGNVLYCDRYDQRRWREFSGDKAVFALFNEALSRRLLAQKAQEACSLLEQGGDPQRAAQLLRAVLGGEPKTAEVEGVPETALEP